MSELPEMEQIDLAHVAALALSIWIYLIAKDEQAVKIIANMASRLHAEITTEDVPNEER